MMTEELGTPEQVQRYLAKAFDTDRTYAVIPCEYGWVCRLVLTEEEIAADMGFGMGNYVVDRATGVITAHGSLHPITIGEQYDEAIRDGESMVGYQVYPPMWEIHVKRDRESEDEIAYRVWGRSLLDPPAESPAEHLLTLDKKTFHYHTDSEATHVTCIHAAVWTEERSRELGSWPETGVFRV